jgi:GGDEF domain-containing protein
MLARRIVRAISQPYLIDGHEIVIGTSIGYALSSATEADLDGLVSLADAALCGIKRNGGGVAAYRPETGAEMRLSA